MYALNRAVEIVHTIADEKIAPASDAHKFSAATTSIGAGVHKAFFSSTTQCYAPANGVSRQGHQLLPLAAEIPPSSVAPAVLACLIDQLTNSSGVAKAHIDTGLHSTYFLAKLLSGGLQQLPGIDTDRPDLLYAAAMDPTWPSYAALVNAGLTTWPETWGIANVAGGVSKMHGTLNGLGLMFQQSILGARYPFGSLNSSWRLEIRPSYCIALARKDVAPLTSAGGTVGTRYGVVKVSWHDSLADNNIPIELNISVPIGAGKNTTVWLVGRSSSVTESGVPASQAVGVRFLSEVTRRGEAYSVWAVSSGTYFFSSHR